MNSIQLLFAFASTVIPGALSVQASGKVSFTFSTQLTRFLIILGVSDVNPIETIFGLCDAEPDKKLSLNEILENNAECWNVLEYVGMQKTTITEEFSMIDKDQNGYVTIDEAYDAAKTLDRKGEKPAPPEQSIYSFNDINMFF